MANTNILVNLDRCIGCWTCSLACKVGNNLPDESYRLTVRTLGDGQGIDSPAGTWPNLHMSWIPTWNQNCTKCAALIAEGLRPYCVRSCPCNAISYGDAAQEMQATLQDDGFHTFKMPPWEQARTDVTYAKKRR